MNFLTTGANGFLGKPLCAELQRRGYAVRAATRTGSTLTGKTEATIVGSIDSGTDWSTALRGIDVVLHLAARVHVMRDKTANPLEQFHKVNVAGTERLARCAAEAGVKRLVYVSSVKVNGESTPSPDSSDGTASHSTRPLKVGDQVAGYPVSGRGERNIFTESDIPNPQDPYGISKWEAEQALHRITAETGLEVVVIRPPLVYGPGVKGNFASLLSAVDKDVPLPLASVKNARSLIYVGNLVDALIACATHPAASGQTYLVSDGEDVSTPELLRRLGSAMGKPVQLLSCPPALLKFAGRLIGKAGQVERLLGSLQVDSGKIRHELGWTPPYTLQQGLQAAAEWYRNAHGC